jgi:hypothetical protein
VDTNILILVILALVLGGAAFLLVKYLIER